METSSSLSSIWTGALKISKTTLIDLIFPTFRVSMTEVVGGLQRSDASGMKVIVIDLGSLSCSI